MPGVFDYSAVDSRLPIGAVVQSPIDLEVMTNGQWLRLDGRDCNRSDYPLVQAQFPAGVFTTTTRTLNAAPATVAFAADSTNFLASGAAGTSALQASPDAITWSTSATWAASTSFSSIIVAGSRWIIAPGAGETQPYVYATGNTAANTVAKASWTATTGASVTALTQGLAYGSTANAGAGRTVLVKDGSLATASAIWYLNDGATAWSAASGGSTMNRKCVVWTGQKFIVFPTSGTLISTSSDGATWTDQGSPWFTVGAGVIGAASDGAGTVVVVGGYANSGYVAGYNILVSKDHGTTWRLISAPDLGAYGMAAAFTVSYTNGKFFISTTNSSTLVSSTGLVWTAEPITARNSAANSSAMYTWVYKAGVYASFSGSGTAAVSATEDMSKFKLFLLQGRAYTNVGEYAALANTPAFMRVK